MSLTRNSKHEETMNPWVRNALEHGTFPDCKSAAVQLKLELQKLSESQGRGVTKVSVRAALHHASTQEQNNGLPRCLGTAHSLWTQPHCTNGKIASEILQSNWQLNMFIEHVLV